MSEASFFSGKEMVLIHLARGMKAPLELAFFNMEEIRLTF